LSNPPKSTVRCCSDYFEKACCGADVLPGCPKALLTERQRVCSAMLTVLQNREMGVKKKMNNNSLREMGDLSFLVL